jgi:hypothetical protein
MVSQMNLSLVVLGVFACPDLQPPHRRHDLAEIAAPALPSLRYWGTGFISSRLKRLRIKNGFISFALGRTLARTIMFLLFSVHAMSSAGSSDFSGGPLCLDRSDFEGLQFGPVFEAAQL